MCQVIETIKTKNYVAEIINDEGCYNPRTDYSLGTLIAFHSRYDLSDNDNWEGRINILCRARAPFNKF